MKLLHGLTCTVFFNPLKEEQSQIEGALKAFLPAQEDQLKIEITQVDQSATQIATLTLKKESHTNAFIKFIQSALTSEQKEELRTQGDRLHDDEGDLNFYLRFAKDEWLNERKLVLTNSGNCFHIKLVLAAFPKRQEVAKNVVNEIFQ